MALIVPPVTRLGSFRAEVCPLRSVRSPTSNSPEPAAGGVVIVQMSPALIFSVPLENACTPPAASMSEMVNVMSAAAPLCVKVNSPLAALNLSVSGAFLKLTVVRS